MAEIRLWQNKGSPCLHKTTEAQTDVGGAPRGYKVDFAKTQPLHLLRYSFPHGVHPVIESSRIPPPYTKF